VDIPRIYGLSNNDLAITKAKIKSQSDFLNYSYIQDNSTGQQFSLKDCIVSSNHSPHRYYGEIQNRINTLELEATNANLTPVFLTITLPSEFHMKKNIRSATSYIMKYINKTLPMSKKEITKRDEYLNAWYIKHRINRFCASRSTAPMYLYRMLNHRFSLYGLTQVRKGNSLKILVGLDDDKIMEIWDDTELLFMRQDNFTVTLMGNAAA